MNNPLKDFCNEWKATFKCREIDCVDCSFLAFVQATTKHIKKGTKMKSAVRTFVTSGIAREKARQIVEEAIKMPLEIAQSILREDGNDNL